MGHGFHGELLVITRGYIVQIACFITPSKWFKQCLRSSCSPLSSPMFLYKMPLGFNRPSEGHVFFLLQNDCSIFKGVSDTQPLKTYKFLCSTFYYKMKSTTPWLDPINYSNVNFARGTRPPILWWKLEGGYMYICIVIYIYMYCCIIYIYIYCYVYCIWYKYIGPHWFNMIRHT